MRHQTAACVRDLGALVMAASNILRRSILIPLGIQELGAAPQHACVSKLAMRPYASNTTL